MNDEVKVLDMTHADEVIREVEGGAAPTLQSRNGTGGNQVPLVMGFSHVASGMMLDSQPSPTSVTLKRSPGGEGAVCVCFKAGQSSNGGLGEEAEVSPTMCHTPSALEPTVAVGVSFDGCKDAPVIPECAHTECVGTNPGFKNGVAVGIDGYNLSVTGDVSATISVAASDFHNTHGVALRHIVRRLTPTECERLQAFPDWWTKIPWRIYKESRRKGMSYERLLNERGMRLREPTTEECPDSPRYKALGNSWATNCAEWILRRIVAAVRLGLIPEEYKPCQTK